MTSALPTDIIVQQCHDKKWQYPKPVEDVDQWVCENTDIFDPQHAHRLYWPDRPYRTGMDILIVDGGTTQAPVIARTNPDARVTATVHSKESLDHAIYLRHKYGLRNLGLHLLPVSDVSDLGQSFDLVIASGALQHAGYAEAQLGMKALAQVLRPEGVAAFLLYSRYLPSDPEYGYQPDSADSFLHSIGANVGVQDCLDLVTGAGLVFQDWLTKAPYYLPSIAGAGNEFLEAIAMLPERQMWSVLEPLRNQTGCHLFTACRPERPAHTYRIDLKDPRALDYVPAWRFHAGLEGGHAVRPGWTMPLDSAGQEVAQKVDGWRSIREIAGPELAPATTELITELWRMDFVMIGLPGTTPLGGCVTT